MFLNIYQYILICSNSSILVVLRPHPCFCVHPRVHVKVSIMRSALCVHCYCILRPRVQHLFVLYPSWCKKEHGTPPAIIVTSSYFLIPRQSFNPAYCVNILCPNFRIDHIRLKISYSIASLLCL